MKRFFFALLGAALFYGCKKSGSACVPERFEYSLQKDRQIDMVRLITPDPSQPYSYQVNQGNKMVFRYRHFFKDCPEIADDEGYLTIVFETPGTTPFRVEDSVALRQSKAMLSYMCECIPGAFFFTKGWIEGEKIDENSWQVRASLSSPLSPSTVFVFSGVFRN